MKTKRHFVIPPTDIAEFITECRKVHIEKFSTQWNKQKQLFECTIETDESYSDALISDLLGIVMRCDLTYEEKDSIYAAIACIKTMADMGVI